jgi:hypothetical protein
VAVRSKISAQFWATFRRKELKKTKYKTIDRREDSETHKKDEMKIEIRLMPLQTLCVLFLP